MADSIGIVEGVAGGLAVAIPLVIQALKDAGQEPLADAVSKALGSSAIDAVADEAERKAAEAFGTAPASSSRTLPGVGGQP